jgi:hypothetical protein
MHLHPDFEESCSSKQRERETPCTILCYHFIKEQDKMVHMVWIMDREKSSTRLHYNTDYKWQGDFLGSCLENTHLPPKGSNKVGKWKPCHQEREMEHFGVTMAKPLRSHAQGIGRKKHIYQ